MAEMTAEFPVGGINAPKVDTNKPASENTPGAFSKFTESLKGIFGKGKSNTAETTATKTNEQVSQSIAQSTDDAKKAEAIRTMLTQGGRDFAGPGIRQADAKQAGSESTGTYTVDSFVDNDKPLMSMREKTGETLGTPAPEQTTTTTTTEEATPQTPEIAAQPATTPEPSAENITSIAPQPAEAEEQKEAA